MPALVHHRERNTFILLSMHNNMNAYVDDARVIIAKDMMRFTEKDSEDAANLWRRLAIENPGNISIGWVWV